MHRHSYLEFWKIRYDYYQKHQLFRAYYDLENHVNILKIIILEVEKMNICCPIWALDWLCLKREKKINMHLNMIRKVLSEDAEESILDNQRIRGNENS